MLLKTLTVGPFQSNCYIWACSETAEATIIDPGDEPQLILEVLRVHSLVLKHIVLTHGHIDHICAVYDIAREHECEVSIHQNDLQLYQSVGIQGMMFGVPTSEVRKPDRFLGEGDLISFGKSENGNVLYTPGHSPGGICIFIQRAEEPSILFSGDTLFAGSIGRTDLWGGDYKELITSIKTKILCLPDDTIVLPGHGPRTSVGEERRFNPFLR